MCIAVRVRGLHPRAGMSHGVSSPSLNRAYPQGRALLSHISNSGCSVRRIAVFKLTRRPRGLAATAVFQNLSARRAWTRRDARRCDGKKQGA